MKEYNNPNYKSGKSSNNVDSLGNAKLTKEKSSNSINKSSSNTNYKGLGSSIFGVIVLILFIVAFSHYIRTGTFINFSFKSMIDYLATMPDVSLQFMQVDLSAYGDWGIFNFAKYIWNFIAQIFEFGITITGLSLQALVVIFFLVSMFFI